VDQCLGGWLPANAEWVTPNVEYPLGCVFACRYGWNVTLGQALQDAIQAAVDGRRKDLGEFWSSVLRFQPVQNMDRALEKVLWPTKTVGMDFIPNQWSQRVAIGMTAAASLSASYARQNTFLYLEGVEIPDGLCAAPEALKATECPAGYNRSAAAAADARTPCALLARTQGVYALQFHDDSKDYYAVVHPVSFEIQCHVPQINVWLHHWSAYDQCEACLDQLKAAHPSEKWLRPMQGLQSWYAFSTPGTCEPGAMTCVGASVSHLDGQVCVPCSSGGATRSEWRTLCYPRVFHEQNCNGNSGKLLTKDDVCIPCSGGLTVLTDGASIVQWDSSRPGWEYTPCRYLCDVGYTSNHNETEYNAGRPCVSCESEVLPVFMANATCDASPGGEAYFDVGAQMQACSYERFLPFTPSCTPCTPTLVGEGADGLRLVGRPFSMAPEGRAGACLAICDPKLYFTLLKTNGSRVFSPVRQEEIWRCQPCGEAYLANCSNLTECIAGYYWCVGCSRRVRLLFGLTHGCVCWQERVGVCGVQHERVRRDARAVPDGMRARLVCGQHVRDVRPSAAVVQ
jgi:hypothetical protein